jgi:hypothetical protein
MNKPTPPQKNFLARVAQVPNDTFQVQFPYGAHCGMRTICEQSGWVVYEGGGYRLTETGRSLVPAATQPGRDLAPAK